MARFWLDFAARGNPNGRRKSADWPRFRNSEYIDLGGELETNGDFRKEKCDFWDNLGPVDPQEQNLKKSVLPFLYNQAGLSG
jgi:hypothetical protein